MANIHNNTTTQAPQNSFVKRHWKGLLLSSIAILSVGVANYLCKDSHNKKIPKISNITRITPDIQGIQPNPTIQKSLHLCNDINRRTYNWQEVGHYVIGHTRHNKNGTVSYVRPYYKPTGITRNKAA